jgi:nucleotide-binding universal stress UspA family protein
MSRILVATDGSAGADRAVDYAAKLSKISGGELLIVNVIGGYGLPGGLFRQFTREQHVWWDQLLASLSAELLKKASDRARSVGVGTILLESRPGDVASTIVTIAQEKGADIIVAGKRGLGQLSELLLGSVSQKLVSLAPLPTIVVP